MIKLNKKDLFDILYGCAILGTGGGGSLERGLEKVYKAFEEGKEFILVDFDELKDEDLIATPYSCGAISPETEEERKKYQRLPLLKESPHVAALLKMEEYLGREIKAVISTELGGGNTAAAFEVAAQAGKYIVDGDPAGRSVPELQHSTYYLNNIPIQPISLVNIFGESAIITDVVDDSRAEDLVRAMAVASKNTIAVVDHVNTSKVLKNAVIRGAISYAWKIGKAFNSAKVEGYNVVDAVIKAGDGVRLFSGVVEKNEWGTVKGFTVGEVEIAGEDEYKGHKYKIWYKNENIIAWRDEKVDVTVPDLICAMDMSKQEPILNPYFEKGMDVAIYALPAPAEWTTKRGLEVFGPRSFGFETDWLSPFEK
ncbi:DUF917 domain-containing protein [Lutispora thermophila]|uniref:DUF917 domain-containing protein n=1 Tax=Lutispora thermophila DSM 19022 TaxID=1122184 RepID=A0A1M6DRI5_9FIRM|nr:DUF917 domain-containing protein [Lutispora thermophila]SHI75730.1 hypothetical protein SAMN02745176_01246 [Lutispora thermophila DSM 19022]